MWILDNLSIRRKLIVVTMLVSVAALVVASGAMAVKDFLNLRASMKRQLMTSAQMVAANSDAALAFQDAAAAGDTLNSLRAQRNIVAACLYGLDGTVLATYFRDGGVELPGAQGVAIDTPQFGADHLEIFSRVSHDGQPIGTVWVQSDLAAFRERLREYAWTLSGVVFASIIVALVLVSRLQKVISGPVLALADAVRKVSTERDYSLQVDGGQRRDELGALIDGFNDMLRQIRERDAALQAHRDDLEQQVATRTSELSDLAEHLKAAKDRAEAASRAKTAFLANMSHEIRTPMTAIIGYADMMVEPEQTFSDRQDALLVIRRNARHLLELINGVLDISKIEADRMTVECIDTELMPLLVEVASLFRPRALEKGLTFNISFDEPLPRSIATDPLRLRQVLMNLLSNALKFTPSGGIGLTVGCDVQQDQFMMRFAVSDTGIGMTAEQIDRLFQPFMQADESMTRRFGGTGLGLAISQQFVKLLGGRIEVKSEANRGTTFTAIIDGGPASGREMLSNLSESGLLGVVVEGATPATARINCRVLLAEDGIDNQRLISLHLRKAGATVVLAENGRIAVDLAMREPFDVILMDMQMPELDGYGATSELRERGFTGPIIALTAHAMAGDRAKCIGAGCTDYLTKPVDKVKLLGTIAHYTVGRGSQLALTPGAATARSASPAASSAVAPAVAPAVPAPAQEALRSSFAGDVDMVEAIDQFVAGLPAQVFSMRQLLANREWPMLKRAVHQIKGAAGGYGFPQITRCAAEAEVKVVEGGPTEAIAAQVQTLIELIRRVQGYEAAREAKGQEKRDAA